MTMMVTPRLMMNVKVVVKRNILLVVSMDMAMVIVMMMNCLTRTVSSLLSLPREQGLEATLPPARLQETTRSRPPSRKVEPPGIILVLRHQKYHIYCPSASLHL